ncbi:hypothetical protein JCM10296v2_000909 [Rhodotorula toruloides]
MASSSQGPAAFDPVTLTSVVLFSSTAADNEKETERTVAATHAALAAWGGLNAIRRMIIAAVDEWQESVCGFRRGGSSYETAFLTYATQMPEHLHIQPGLNAPEDRIHLTLPALVMRVTLARDQYHLRQWAIAVRGFNPPEAVTEIAGPALLRAQQPSSNVLPCVFTHKSSRRTVLEKGLPVKTRSIARHNVHIYMKQQDIDGYQVSGVTEDRALLSVPPRRVLFDFDLTVPRAKSNSPSPLHLRITFDLDYGQPGHAGAVMAHEVVARSLGVRTPRLLRRW